MTSSRMTERLIAMLEERGVEYKTYGFIGGKAVTWHGSVCDWVALPDESGLAVAVYKDYLTPEQAIAATLGSGREKELEELVRDWRACDPKCTNRSCGDCEHDEDDGCGLYRRMCELGVIA